MESVSEELTELDMKITAVLDVRLFSLVESCQRLEEMYCLHFQGRGLHYTLNARASGSYETLVTFYKITRGRNMWSYLFTVKKSCYPKLSCPLLSKATELLQWSDPPSNGSIL
jgi:hypothetical protein